MYSNPAVDHVLVATKLLVRGISVRESNPPTALRSPDALDGADVLRTGSRRVSNAQRRVAKRCLRYGRPYRQRGRRLLTGPFISGETPAPFTSRSPGIATLGPSCTPSRQLGMLFQKALNEVSSRRCSWHQVHSLGCSPDGQSSVYCDLPTRCWLRYFSAPKVDVIRVGSWLVRDAGGSRTHLMRFCRPPPCRLAPASLCPLH